MSIEIALLLLNLVALIFGGGFAYGKLNGKLAAIESNVIRINGEIDIHDSRIRFLETER